MNPSGPELKKTRRGGASDVRTPSDRLPPHSTEMEAGVLSCALLSPVEVLDTLTERGVLGEWFYDLRHKTIYEAMAAMHGNRQPVDLITLQQRLKDDGWLEKLGGIPFLSQLQDQVPSAANLAYYLESVRDHWRLRRWLALCGRITARIYEHQGEVDALEEEVSADLHRLCASSVGGGERTMAEIVADVHREYLDKFRRGVKRHVGPQTGFNYLDNIVPGAGPGQVIYVAARPSMGKSALMLQIMANMAEMGHPTGAFSLEMTNTSLGARAMFERGGADMIKFLNGFAEAADKEKLAAAGDNLATLPLVFDDTPALSVEQLCIKARRMVRKHQLKVLWIDYAQLLSSRRRFENRNVEMAFISVTIKALARELGIPIFVLTQMNREIEKEAHRRPRLSDLRDSGQIEQDADGVWFLWKPDVASESWKKRIAGILPRVPVPEDWKLEATWKKKLAIVTLTVAKQREGPSNEDATMVFIKPWTRFIDAYRPAAAVQQPLTEAPAEPAKEGEKGELAPGLEVPADYFDSLPPAPEEPEGEE